MTTPLNQPKIKGSEVFGQLRVQTEKALLALLEDSQGKMNFDLQSRPLAKLFTPSEAAKMVGVSGTTLRKIEETLVKSGAIEPVEKNPSTGKRLGYTFHVIQEARKYQGTLPWRKPEVDPCLTVAVIHFKGGVGKTETASNCARSFALKGYRVAIIDLDHQGSTTGSFGYLPDYHFKKEHTIIPYVSGEQESLHYALQKTAWPNIQLIPGCMALEDFNWSLAFDAMDSSFEDRRDLHYELKRGIDTIKEDFDVILIDSPPSSSINSFSIIAAADGIVVPLPPAKHDLASTAQFAAIGEQLTSGILEDKHYHFFRILVTKFQNQGNRSDNDRDFRSIYQNFMADWCYEKVFRQMAPITDAAAEFTTVYEMQNPNKDILKELDQVFGQIELDIISHWPSKKDYLTKLGYGG